MAGGVGGEALEMNRPQACAGLQILTPALGSEPRAFARPQPLRGEQGSSSDQGHRPSTAGSQEAGNFQGGKVKK